MNNFLKSVYQKMASYCAYQERCQQELIARMKKYNLRREEQELILSRLREDRFLSEKRFAESFTRGKFRSNRWGKLKIRYALAQKGISEHDIRHGLQEISDEEYADGLRYILQQKIDRLKPELSSLEKRQRLYAFAQQKGYEMDWIKRSIKELEDKF